MKGRFKETNIKSKTFKIHMNESNWRRLMKVKEMLFFFKVNMQTPPFQSLIHHYEKTEKGGKRKRNRKYIFFDNSLQIDYQE